MHHHSFVTVFGVSICLHEVCNNSFSTQMERVGPNAGWHEEFLVFCYPVGQSSDCFGGLNPSSAHDLCNISGSISQTMCHVYKIPSCQPSYIIIQSGKNIWRNVTREGKMTLKFTRSFVLYNHQLYRALPHIQPHAFR